MESYGRTRADARLCVALAALLSLFALDCAGTASDDPPGTSLGTFHATALLTSSSCGTGVDAPTSYEFDVVLSQDDTAIYWTQSGTTLVGSLDDDEATWTYQAPAQTDGLCTIEQQEIFDAKLDDVDRPKTLKGTIQENVSAASSSTCSRQATAAGGTFDNLPCTVGYVFSAKLK